MDQSLISIFDKDTNTPELMQSMRDLASLSGVLRDLGTESTFESPIEMLRFLRIIQLINEEALGLSERIDNAETVYYRYKHRYADPDPPRKKRVEQVISILVKNNWVSKLTNQIRMRDRGKRMMDALIRLANDSLAYYIHDDIGRSLFQARRDAELSEAYDDHGISGGNTIMSMIHHVKSSILMLQERELELLADRNALPQLQVIHGLMEELDGKMEERLAAFATLEDSLVMSTLVQKGTTVMMEGTHLSVGMINKYMRFTSMQQGPAFSNIVPEKVRKFITQMFDPPVESDIPNVHQIFSFMEQNRYDEEAFDGLWLPVKVATPLSASAIDEAIEHLETYEPVVVDHIEEEEAPTYVAEEVAERDVASVIGDAKWLLTMSMIDTKAIEAYLKKHDEVGLERLIVEASSPSFGDAVAGLTAVAALAGNKKITFKKESNQQHYEKEWEWERDEDGQVNVKRRS